MGGSFYSPTLHTYAARQWRRLSFYETYSSYSSAGLAPPLTARLPRELEWAINNAKAFVFPPRRQMLFFPRLESVLGSTEERVAHVFVPMEFADGYESIFWNIGHQRIAGSGGDKTTWRLYCSWMLYRGPDIFDASYLSPWYGSDSIETVKDAHDYDDSAALQVSRDADSLVWLVLTSQNNTVTAQSHLTQLSTVGRCA